MSSELRAGDMAVQWQPFTSFHPVHGANVRIDPTATQATRVESFANGICFSRDPLEPGQLFLVEIEEKEWGWCGHLRVGLTARDPRSLDVVPEYSLPDLVNQGDSWVFAITRNHNRMAQGEEGGPSSGNELLSDPYLKVGKYKISRDKLVARSKPGRYSHILDDLYKTNVLPPTARRSRIGVLYEPQSDGTRHMHIVINGEDMGASARGIPASQPLYAVVDVFASTKSVRVIQLEYGFSSLQTLCRLVIQKHMIRRLDIDQLDLPQLLKNFCKFE
ncbi:neuralized-like protein 2 [Mantella aurantiaca]